MPWKPWQIVDFSGGLNNKLDDNLIADNQCVDVQNCIAVTVGRLQKRRGQAKLNAAALGGPIQGLHAYYYGDALQNRKLIAVANGIASYWNGEGFTNIKTGLSTTAQVLFATCVNYMVAMNGYDPPWKWDGANQTPLANSPATGKCPVLHKEKLFCIADVDTIRWSDSFAPETWPGVNVWDFDKGDGDELSALFTYGRELLACKKRSIFNLAGSSMDDFRSDRVESKHGVAGPRAGVVVEPYFYYISVDGIFRWDGLRSTDLTRDTIPQTWAGVNKSALDKAVAGYVDGRLWFCVPEGASTTNNMVLVYDPTYNSWWVFRGIEASCLVNFNDGTTLHTYTGHATQGFVVEQNTGFNDLGAIISAYWVGKNFDGGDPVRIKKIKKAFAVDANGLNDAVFNYRLNYGAWQVPAAVTDINDVRKYAIPSGKCRFFQPKFTHDVLDQDFALSGFEALYKLKKAK
jgi:hypothetical protein